jgi:prepilin-type N-terminal cleavage/methylation domain-containing protein
MNKYIQYRGFTLIEVLVVISIIGILSVIVYASFGDARNSAKNRAFQVELKETQLAINLYKAQFGSYPKSLEAGSNCKYEVICDPVGSTDCIIAGIARTDTCDVDAPIIVGLIPDFIPSLPDPSSSGNPNCVLQYQVIDVLGYKLTAINCHVGETKEEGVPEDSEFSRCPSSCASTACAEEPYIDFVKEEDFYNSYAIYSNLGQCA